MAFTAVTSIATIGLYISYVIPTMLRLTIGRNDFVPGAPDPHSDPEPEPYGFLARTYSSVFLNLLFACAEAVKKQTLVFIA